MECLDKVLRRRTAGSPPAQTGSRSGRCSRRRRLERHPHHPPQPNQPSLLMEMAKRRRSQHSLPQLQPLRKLYIHRKTYLWRSIVQKCPSMRSNRATVREEGPGVHPCPPQPPPRLPRRREAPPPPFPVRWPPRPPCQCRPWEAPPSLPLQPLPRTTPVCRLSWRPAPLIPLLQRRLCIVLQ